MGLPKARHPPSTSLSFHCACENHRGKDASGLSEDIVDLITKSSNGIFINAKETFSKATKEDPDFHSIFCIQDNLNKLSPKTSQIFSNLISNAEKNLANQGKRA